MTVTATEAALRILAELRAAHGPLALHESGGCCDGSAPICLRRGELPIAASDLLLGAVGDTPFYIDADQYERWGRPDLVLDAAPGAREGFSLGPDDAHLVARTAAC
jgi:uncharacterized protein (DUF779 family)